MDTKAAKVIIIGDAGVGKTTFVRRHHTGDFNKYYVSTMSVEVTPLVFNTSVGTVVLFTWDCSGQEKFNKYLPGYFAEAEAAIIMFDIEYPISYKNVEYWVKTIRNSHPNIPIVLCGNKVDVEDRKVLPKHISKDRWDTQGIQYYDLSVKSCYNHEKPFLYILRKLYGEGTEIVLPKDEGGAEIDLE